MSHARRPVNGHQSKNRRCGLAVRAAQRRFSQFERLEDRNLLAGELLPNVWHNASDPYDVNVDARVTPVDLLVVINALNQGGSRGLIASDLPSPTTGAGEAESDSIQGMKIDVNADRALTPLDALMLIKRLNAEAEPPQALVAISAFAMNDPPVLSIPNPITVPEGTLEVPLALNVTDSDVGAGTMQLTATVNGGTLTLGDASRLTYSSGGGTNNTSFSATGTLADIKAALNAASGTKFFPQSTDYNGTATVILTVDDLGNTGVDGAKQSTKTVTITVTPVNDAPINTVPGQQTVQQNAALVFSAANGNRLSVADLDGDVRVQTDLQVDAGTLTAPAFSGSGTARLQLAGKVSAVNAALASVAYTPGSALGITSLMMTTNDLGNIGQGDILTCTSLININVVLPTLPYASNDSKTVLEDSTNNAIDVLVNDVKTSGGSLSITHLNGAAVGGSVATTHGAVTLSGTSVRYTPAGNYYGPDSFTYTIADSNVGNGPSTGTVAVTVTADNDAPTLKITGETRQVAEEQTLALNPGTTFTVADIDADGGSGVQVDVRVSHGTLTVGAASGATVTHPAPERVVLTGLIDQVNGALNSLSYTPTDNYNGSDNLTVLVDDLGNTGGTVVDSKKAAGTVSITVTPVNDAPTVKAPVNAATMENTALPFPAGGASEISVADVDNANLPVELTVDSGSLKLATTAGLDVVVNDNTAHVQISGSLATLNAALNGLTYTPPSSFVGKATLIVTTHDAEPLGASKTVTIDVSGTNDPPVVSVPGNLAIDENAVWTFNGTISVADVDGGAFDQDVTVSVTHGTFTVKAVAGVDLTGNVSSLVTLRGPLSGINDALNGAEYRAEPHVNTPDTGIRPVLTITANDNGHTGFGQPETDTKSFTISLNAINDDPTAVNDYSAAVPLLILQDSKDNRIDVLANDGFAPDINETLTIQSSTAGTRGTVTTDGRYVYYSHTSAAGPGTDQFTYTINDGHGGTSTATVYVQVVDFVPSNVSGYVHLDLDGDGVKDANELGVGNVPITLTGTNIQGTAVNLTTMTDGTGCYTFHNVLPTKTGSIYRITETQPSGVTDGGAHVGDQGGTVVSSNVMEVFLPMFSYPTGITGAGNNFVELGLSQRYASLYLGDLLHSGMSGQTGAQGMVFGVDATGNVQWFMNLGGWDGLTPTQVVAGKLNVTNTATGTVTQVSLSSSLVQSATDASGGMAYRLYGNAAGFITNSGGEGESGRSMAQYEQAVDALFAQGGTAL